MFFVLRVCPGGYLSSGVVLGLLSGATLPKELSSTNPQRHEEHLVHGGPSVVLLQGEGEGS